MKLGQYISTPPKHTFNADTGLFEAKLDGAFGFVMPPAIYFGIFSEMKRAIAEFEAHQAEQGNVVRFGKVDDG